MSSPAEHAAPVTPEEGRVWVLATRLRLAPLEKVVAECEDGLTKNVARTLLTCRRVIDELVADDFFSMDLEDLEEVSHA